MAVLKRQFGISQSGLESCPWPKGDPCHHSRQAPSPYSAFHARWLAPRGLCQATAGTRKGSRGRNSACRMEGTWQVPASSRHRPAHLVTLDPWTPVNLPCEPWKRGPHTRVEFWSWFPELSCRAQRYAHRGQGDKAGFWFRG